MSHPRCHRIAVCCLLASAALGSHFSAQAAIEIGDVKHPGDVDFEKEILPLLRRSCLACHNSSHAENELILETPDKIVKGGAEGRWWCRARAARAGC